MFDYKVKLEDITNSVNPCQLWAPHVLGNNNYIINLTTMAKGRIRKKNRNLPTLEIVDNLKLSTVILKYKVGKK